jgi:hypothetical protein
MTLVFITNFINHHQVHLADEFHRLIGDGYRFVETQSIPESFVQSGYPVYERDYVVKAYADEDQMRKARQLALDADVVIIGSAPESFVTDRIAQGKLTFRYSERWFKSRPWFLTGPKGWMNFYRNHIRHNDKPLYMLCASAFTAEDVNTIGAYKGKCFRWGYFTKVEDVDIEAVTASEDNLHRLMWCARFLKWKHPELPVRLADRLKRRGYRFILDMYGTGEELEETRLLANMLNVEDVVRFCGNCPNDEILSQMRRHDVFLFTSDKNEGWGAVLNEAMSNGCAVVGSDRIGAVPFLVEDGVNGLIFTSESLESLEDKVCRLLDDPQSRKMMARNAYMTMKDVWSEQNAARQFLALVGGITKNDTDLIPKSGPCSRI